MSEHASNIFLKKLCREEAIYKLKAFHYCLNNFIFIRDVFTRMLKIRDGSKFMGYSGRDHQQGAKTFYEKNYGGGSFF